jgi:hypothetical protein
MVDAEPIISPAKPGVFASVRIEVPPEVMKPRSGRSHRYMRGRVDRLCFLEMGAIGIEVADGQLAPGREWAPPLHVVSAEPAGRECRARRHPRTVPPSPTAARRSSSSACRSERPYRMRVVTCEPSMRCRRFRLNLGAPALYNSRPASCPTLCTAMPSPLPDPAASDIADRFGL